MYKGSTLLIEAFRRFANILLLTNTDFQTIWIVVKNIKSEFISKNCPTWQQLHSREIIRSQITKVEEHLKVTTSEQIFENMTETELQPAAEMFIYLTTCSQSVKSWYFFYEDLFTQHSTAEIIVTLNRVLKGERTQKNMNTKRIATNIFKKLDHFLSLKYFEVKNMTKGIISSFLEKVKGN